MNKFRGDVSLLEPGLDMLHGLTGRRTYGVLPFRHGLGIDEEDGLRVSLRGTVRESVVAPPVGEDVLRVAVCAVPLMSNFTDVDALAAEPGVVVHPVGRPPRGPWHPLGRPCGRCVQMHRPALLYG